MIKQGVALRSKFENFERHRNEMKLWFLNRGYRKWLTDKEAKKVKFRCTSRKRDTKMKEIPLVITYYPLLKDFTSVVRKHLYIFYLSKEVKKTFTLGPMVSFRGARKLGSYLVRDRLYPIERSVGWFKCNGILCQVCLNVTKTKTFSSTVTKKEYIINHKFNCNDKCLIYFLTCKKCMLQYLGKNVDEYQLRWIIYIYIKMTLWCIYNKSLGDCLSQNHFYGELNQ